ncbi:MAG: tyrosine-type recombinase/integrase [Chloroflexi bacterium]|nr:tyrosine-type recombinase/integrase [Chloroflexota bacterium]
MEGSLRKRSRKSWELCIEIGRGSDGRRLRKFVAVKGTKAEAQQKLRELLSSLDKGTPIDNPKTTVQEFLALWHEQYVKTITSPRTQEGYLEKINGYIIPTLGNVRLTKLTPQHVQGLYSEMLERGLSPRTVLHAHRILREALGHAVKWGLLIRNVCDATDPPKPQRKPMTSLDPDQARRFLDFAQESRYGPLFFLGIYTGLRRSEMLGLRWSSIDLQSKTLPVTETLQRIKGRGLMLLPPKTDRSRRMVTLPPSAAALLSGLKVKQRDERIGLGLPWQESDLVFTHLDGRPFDPSTVSHAFADIIRKSGLPHIRLHDLRHTHASLMLKQGVNPKSSAND